MLPFLIQQVTSRCFESSKKGDRINRAKLFNRLPYNLLLSQALESPA